MTWFDDTWAVPLSTSSSTWLPRRIDTGCHAVSRLAGRHRVLPSTCLEPCPRMKFPGELFTKLQLKIDNLDLRMRKSHADYIWRPAAIITGSLQPDLPLRCQLLVVVTRCSGTCLSGCRLLIAILTDLHIFRARHITRGTHWSGSNLIIWCIFNQPIYCANANFNRQLLPIEYFRWPLPIEYSTNSMGDSYRVRMPLFCYTWMMRNLQARC